MTDANALSDAVFMTALLDEMIPPEGDIPGAGSLELMPAIEAMLEPTPEVREPIEAGLSAIRVAALDRDPGGLPALDADGRLEVINGVLDKDPALMPLLQMFVYLVYYQNPKVLQAHGLTGRPPFPEGRDIDATDESLLKKLRPDR